MTVHKLKESIAVGQAGGEEGGAGRGGGAVSSGGGLSLPWETILCATLTRLEALLSFGCLM